MNYSVDTSALLDAWSRYYPLDVFPSLWQHLDALAKAARLFAIDEVLRELEKKDDGLHSWIKDRPQMIVALNETVQVRAKAIINRFPSLTNSSSTMSGRADPFVIALAQEQGLTVVSAEKSKPSKPRIPDVCASLGVRCMPIVEMFRSEGWRV